ncbi:MAG: nucleotidyltransferase domain-containing protein [Proteobacteria bacterium]|nr:nucleotidyltransferase domain-containing protein [Pseudomonadota bacterium]
MSAVDFLFTPGVQRVLGLVFSRPEQEFTLKDLLDRAGAGNGNSQRHIEQLIKAGVLEEGPRRGRQRAIKANTAHFLYPELRTIALKSFALVEPLRDALAPFADRIDEAFVFGSVATGSDSHRSDIDLIVVGSAPLLDLTQSLADVESRLGRQVHLAVYTAQEWAGLRRSDPVLAQISESSKLSVLPHGAST